ncbi:MAG: hypothetical protein KIT09_02180 [Bryobacteraceae bacterium]|nr:hypothetical protein [Bryobacteraceae bacterium]
MGRFRRFPELTVSREQALLALLATGNVEKAAKRCGLSRTTLFRFLKDPEFRRVYRQARRELVEEAVTELQRGAIDASTALRAIVTNRKASASARVQAAKTILEAVREAELAEISARLDELERERADPEAIARRSAESREAVLDWLKRQDVESLSDAELQFVIQNGTKGEEQEIDKQT